MRFFSFSLLIGGGAVLGHLYLWRLVRQVAPSRAWRRGLGGLLLVMTGALLLRGPIRDIGPTVERGYEVVAYSWMAVALCFVIALAIGDLTRLTLWIVRRTLGRREPERSADLPSERARASTEPAEGTTRSSGSALPDGLATSPAMGSERSRPASTAAGSLFDPTRRRFLTQALPWSVVGGGLLTAGYGTLRAFVPPDVTEVELRLPKLPRRLDGLTIAQLTDIHVGPFIRRGYIDALVAEVNALRPDLVVVTGDLVDGDVRTLGDAVAGLARLRSRFGTYFVTGNHEYYSGVEPWTRFLESLGISVLRNRRVAIGDAGASLDLVGVDDWSGARRRGGQGYDLEAALAGRDDDRAAVLLAHQPLGFEAAVERGMGLQISGHTHGGQLFPMTALVGLAYPYCRGLYRREDSHIYVSRGCGFWGPPARVGSPPEIVRYALTS